MTTILLTACLSCKRVLEDGTCTAFPDGIPADIWEGMADHQVSRDGEPTYLADPERGADAEAWKAKAEQLDSLDIDALTADVFHLPGRHDQRTHGRGRGAGAPANLPELDVGYLGEHEFVKKISPRTSSQAMKEANPNYSMEPIEDDPLMGIVSYQANCTHAVTAYELRRRGYDVEARSGMGLGPSAYFELNFANERRLRTEVIHRPGNTANQVTSMVADAYPVGSRGTAQVDWMIPGSPERASSGMGHIFSWEHDQTGVRFIDPQKGKAFSEEAWDRAVGTVTLERLDDVPFKSGVKDAVKAVS